MKTRKLLSVILVLAMVLAITPLSAMAADASVRPIVRRNGAYTAEKLSNPTAGEGEADGLVDGGDRLNSYAWSMESLCDASGDYLYIGGNRGIIVSASSAFTQALTAEMGEENAKALINMLYNGDVPTDGTKLDYASACIVRYNMKTGEMEKWFDSAAQLQGSEPYFKYVYGFRAAISYKNAIYMNAMTAAGSAIYRISSNAQTLPEIVIRGNGAAASGQNLRAMAVSADGETLYIGGVQAVQDAEKQDFNVIIYKSTDGTSFSPIADYRDFLFYEQKGSGYYTSSGDVWDMAEYQGALYITVLTPKGALLFKAHEDASDPKANEYGWVFEEICGDNGGQFAPGFGNAQNYTMTPYVYGKDLYFLTFSDANSAIMTFGTAMNTYFSAEEKDISVVLDSYKAIEAVMENETSVYRLTDGGKWQMTVGDRDKCVKGIEYAARLGSGFNHDEYGTTAYNWRAAVYNGKLYIGTLDASGMFKYTTKLTCGDLLDMDSEEFRTQLDYTVTFLRGMLGSSSAWNGILPTGKSTLLGTTLTDAAVDTLLDALVAMQSMINREATVDLMEEVLLTLPQAKAVVSALYYRIRLQSKLLPGTFLTRMLWRRLLTNVGAVKDALDAIDTEGLESYVTVSRTIADNENPGCELYSTTDGIHFEAVTLDGFGDKYNLGVRTLLPTQYGLMVGTANSFYGAQLWKVTEAR